MTFYLPYSCDSILYNFQTSQDSFHSFNESQKCDSFLKWFNFFFFLLNAQHTEWPVGYAGVGKCLQIKSMSIESSESVK